MTPIAWGHSTGRIRDCQFLSWNARTRTGLRADSTPESARVDALNISVEKGRPLPHGTPRSKETERFIMAHKKGQGSVRNGRDSVSKRLGTKAFGGEFVTAGSIIIRQRGSSYVAGNNVGTGRDWSLFALANGKVRFDKEGQRVNIDPAAVESASAPKN
jgi:large subunit ribosomal protein L27